ncbi:flagellar biosynthesis protein FlhB [Vulcaniibacterium tengchongense]|uniref:Flagellar biosynthetic protein FlhB n=1 Tax=Vulcaniibacterium tengchongense TaxID=1273429 RepID=A0A3N4VNP0_9GAMM|nr:flagellar biosynthesis protein FlhB [Vulcaniibacterium tengchongense]RPE80851.1 flagellar biosynthetic protein FlhB [Vulcaniibacterium tengchongense]
MASEDQEDRTEQPSAKRLREARERGDVPRSRELGNAAVLGAGALALLVAGPGIGAAARGWMREALTLDPALLGRHDRLLARAAELGLGLLAPLWPLLLAALAACFVAPLLMGGLRFSGQALQPDLQRLGPLAGLKRLYGREAVAELLRSLLRVALIGGLGGAAVYGAFPRLLAMAGMPLQEAAGAGLAFVAKTLLAMVGALALLALIDVPWQHWRYRDRLKMTKQELRDEFKESEGNPEVKARVRQVAAQLSRRRMMEAVPTADVVVTNPTHYAVALKYEAERMRAPRVVAKGADEIALAIRELAGKHRVAIVEAPPLARALYRHAQIDQEIPVKLYAAVAQVLSYVYQLKRWHPARGPMPALGEVGVDPALADEPRADGEPSP